jgi:hypothetical protein
MPSARKVSKRNDVERHIHFYRADCGADKQGKRIAFKPAPALKYIDELPFASFATASGRYYEEDDNIYCCWVDSPSRVQFAVIRRGALPTIEEEGIRTALNLSETAGLVEAIHVRMFPDNIVGFDFNFYGPRLPRFGRYLNTVAAGQCEEVVFEPLLRQDVVSELEGGRELRMFSLRIRRSELATVAAIDKSLASAFKTVGELTDATELEIVVRPKPYSGKSIGKRLMSTTRKLAARSNVRDVASSFRVSVAQPGAAAEVVDLLGDHFIADARILKQSAKGRALDSADAYANIEAAYTSRSKELKKAASAA